MKQADKNDVDLLLRKLARGAASASGAPEVNERELAVGVGAHLDADELSSFAEGVLPAATRTQYLAHLADCDRCRGVVAQLTLASGARSSERIRDREAHESGGWWRSIAALFTPSVLRYAVPALGLFAVIVVGIAVLRQPGSEFLAKREQPGPSARTEVKRLPAEGEGNSAAAVPSEQGPGQSQVEAKIRETKTGKNDRQVSSTESTTSAADSKAKDSAANASANGGAERSPSAAKPGAAAAPATETAETIQKREGAEEEKQSAESRSATTRRAEADKENRADEERARNQPAVAKTQSALPVNGRGGYLDLKPSGSAAAKKAGNETETRNAGGRRFRRQGSIWVDIAYEAGRSTTDVARGSEQYRALVADEPGIGSIAEQLSGEVIIVWKGRAYRIR